MKVSQQVLEWQAEARAEGMLRGQVKERAEAILDLLSMRFTNPVPEDLADIVRATQDLEKLNRWFRVAAATSSVDDFRHALSNGGT